MRLEMASNTFGSGKANIIWEKGLMAEWLGKGLQNLVQRFESASDLNFKEKVLEVIASEDFFFVWARDRARGGIIGV